LSSRVNRERSSKRYASSAIRVLSLRTANIRMSVNSIALRYSTAAHSTMSGIDSAATRFG